MTDLPPLFLRKREERRIRGGHLWIFSNEVDTRRSPLDRFEPGQQVRINDAQGRFLGYGYVNPHSLICARLVSRDRNHPLDRSLITHRLKIALSLRQRLFDRPFYRLVHGEADLLPGLVVDRFGEVVTLQTTTAGMERRLEEIIEALEKVIGPKAIIARNDGAIRELEGLERYTRVVAGEAPEVLQVEENGARYRVPALTGQKTGWFYDHRLNRARAARYVEGKRVLDLFSYMGGWTIPAALAGAKEVIAVDQSATALEGLEATARLNGVEERIETRKGDAFEILKTLREAGEKFDVVILDPPAFIPRKKDLARGMEAYRRINQMAMQVLERDGILVSASCSFHLKRDQLRSTLLKAARHLDRHAVILEQGHQGPDHPVHPAIVETDYLKSFILRVVPA